MGLLKYAKFRNFNFRTWNKFLFMKYHQLNWSQLQTYKSFSMKAPLFQITIFDPARLGLLQPVKDKRIVVFGSILQTIAGKIMINNHRMTFIQTLHEVRSNLKQGSIVLVSLYPAIKYSQKQSITEQIQQILALWLQEGSNKKVSYRNKNKHISLDSDFAKLFPILYPFKLEQWLIQPQIPMHLINSYHLAPQTSTPSIFCQTHWIMVHIYMLKSLNSSIELTADILAFLQILQKFNFIGFLAFYINDNEVRLQEKICKLVKSFKWKSLHTQKYLNFLVKSFGPRSLIKIIEDYIFIAEQYQNYVKIQGQQFQNLQINSENKFNNSQTKKEVKAGLFKKRK